MNKNLLQRAEQLNTKKKRRRGWKKLVSILGCLVVFCTTYALILPAITQERQTFCGQDAHIHGDECYVSVGPTEQTVFSCSYEALNVHVHDPSCYDQQGRVLCGQADYVIHYHEASCYDLMGDLACPLPQADQHVHTEDCYDLVNRHIHDSRCYTMEPGELRCELPEEAGHIHTDACYGPGELLLCTVEEGHTHNEGCFAEEQLICPIPEGHFHDAFCYEPVLQCMLPETEGHLHEEFCYEQVPVLTCPLEEYAGDPVLVCTEPEAAFHIHTEDCSHTEPLEQPLTCQLAEDETHTHSKRCYGWWDLICPMEEHTHVLTCYADKTADVETEAVWKNTFSHVELTGDWAKDVLAIAKTQLGYHESVRNYIVLEDGETTRGYTRYGDWYGDHYGDWCAMFTSFCLHYAGVDTVPLEASCPQWIELLSDPELDLYRKADIYTPKSGDLIFFDYEQDGISDHVGFVVEQLEPTAQTPAQYRTLEGNSANQVRYVTYDLDDERIQGFGILPENPHQEEPETHIHEEACYDEEGNLICEQEEAEELHIHDASCYDEEGNLICEQDETEELHIHDASCYDEEGNLICEQDETEELHIHDASCYDEEGNLICEQDETEEPAALFCGLEEHSHSEACYGEDGSLVCQLPEHTHSILCTADLQDLSEEDRSAVETLILQIEELPTAEEVDNTLLAFEETENYDAMTLWEESIVQQVKSIHKTYSELSEDLQSRVVNRDKLLELNGMWSMFLMSEDTGDTIAITTAYNSSLITSDKEFVLYTQGSDGKYYAIDGNANAVEIQIDSSGAIRSDVADVNTLYWIFYDHEAFEQRPSYDIQNVATKKYLHPHQDSNSRGALHSGQWESALYTSGSGVKFRGARQNHYAVLSGNTFTNIGNQDNASTFYFGLAPSKCTIWLDGTNGGLMSMYGSPNTAYPVMTGSTFILPETWPSPTKYSYVLRGWFNVATGDYYAPGEEITVTDSAVFYADWVAASYNIGQFNANVVDTVSTNQFITTHVFDYGPVFNLYSTYANVTVNSSSHSETWAMRTDSGSLDYIFRDWDDSRQFSYPSSVGNDNTYTGDPYYWGLYSPSLENLLFGTSNSYDPVSKTGVLGKQYLGTADHLFQYGSDPNDPDHYGYYYYDSELNAAAYNQSAGRFYVYDYLERTTDSIAENNTKSDFLPLNSPYVNTNGKTAPTDVRSDGTLRYTYDAKDNGSNTSANHVHANYWFGLKTEIDFYLPSTPGTRDGDGTLANQSIQGDDMVFEFSGDDDVWVLVDGQLVLDIGGIHGATSGTINFSTGDVVVDGEPTGNVRNLTGGNHTLTMLYLERGSSQSNCKVRFNLSTRYHFTIQKEDFLTRDKLNGAEFTVYTDAACTKPAALWNSEAAHQRGEASTNVFTVTNGKAEMWGFAAGNTYYILETKVPEGYGSANGIIKMTLNNLGTSSFEVIPRGDGTQVSAGFTVHGFKIDQETQMAELIATNFDGEETTSVAVQKVWNDRLDHSTQSVTVYLLADNQRIQEITLSSGNNWFYQWNSLPKFRSGTTEEIVYSVAESTVSGYVSKVEQVTASTSNRSTGGWEAVSSFDENGVYLLGTSSGYLAAENNLFSWITDEATAQATPASRWNATVSSGTVTLVNEAGTTIRFRGWQFYPDASSGSNTALVFNNGRLGAPSYDAILYMGSMDYHRTCIWNTGSFDSAMVFTLQKETSGSTPPPVAESNYNYRITNTPVAQEETISITVQKHWDPGNMGTIDMYEQEIIPIKLLNNGVDSGMSLEVSLRTGWKGTFTGLPKKDANGQEIVYTVVEDWSLPGWRTDYGELMPSEDAANAWTIDVTNVNTMVYMLPETGGTGHPLYTTVGLLLTAAALLLLYIHMTKRRREGRNTP